MDKYLYRTNAAGARGALRTDKHEKRQALRFNPFAPPVGGKTDKERRQEVFKSKQRADKLLAPVRAQKEPAPAPPPAESSSKALRNHLLNTLTDESNPITHSAAYSRAENVSSCSTGHQTGDGGRSKAYYVSRSKKLRDQTQERGQESTVFQGVTVYINGYMAGTTDIEIKRIVGLGGGKVRYMAGGDTTHILTSQPLSGSKTEKHLNKNGRKVHVVRPEWVLDSVRLGKRQTEWNYNVVSSKVQGSLGIGAKENVAIDLTGD